MPYLFPLEQEDVNLNFTVTTVGQIASLARRIF